MQISRHSISGVVCGRGGTMLISTWTEQMVFAQRVQLIFGIFNFPRDNRKFKVPFNNVSECPQEYELQLERKRRRRPCDLESGNGTLWLAG